MCILKPLLVAACWLETGQAGLCHRQGTAYSANSSAGIFKPSSRLLWSCFLKIPTDRACEFSSWFQSGSHSGFLWDAPLQNTFLSPAWQSECCPQACAGMLPVCWAAVLAGTEWSGSGPLWMPLSPALAVFPAPPALATSGQLCALNRS